jgi:hypothetical protein
MGLTNFSKFSTERCKFTAGWYNLPGWLMKRKLDSFHLVAIRSPGISFRLCLSSSIKQCLTNDLPSAFEAFFRQRVCLVEGSLISYSAWEENSYPGRWFFMFFTTHSFFVILFVWEENKKYHDYLCCHVNFSIVVTW